MLGKLEREKLKQEQPFIYTATVMGFKQKLRTRKSSLVDEDDYLVPVRSKSILNKALLNAVNEGAHERIKSLVDAGADVNATDFCGETALQVAVTNEHEKCVECLLTGGADVNKAVSMDSTVLMQAAARGNSRVVKLLVKYGANVHTTDMFGITALMKAAEAGHCECVNALVRAGARVNEKDMSGNTALTKATQRGNTECSRILSESDDDALTIETDNSGHVMLRNGVDVNGISCV